jgi:hypothetical protein
VGIARWYVSRFGRPTAAHTLRSCEVGVVVRVRLRLTVKRGDDGVCDDGDGGWWELRVGMFRGLVDQPLHIPYEVAKSALLYGYAYG